MIKAIPLNRQSDVFAYTDHPLHGVNRRCPSEFESTSSTRTISNQINPAIGCKIPPKKAKEMQILCKNELTRFLAETKDADLYALFLLELSTGVRREDILGLQ